MGTEFRRQTCTVVQQLYHVHRNYQILFLLYGLYAYMPLLLVELHEISVQGLQGGDQKKSFFPFVQMELFLQMGAAHD